MTTFQNLLNDSYQGRFVVEPNELVEVHVDYPKMEITVLTFRTKKQITPDTKKVFHSLSGHNFGMPTVEEKFNEIMEGLK